MLVFLLNTLFLALFAVASARPTRQYHCPISHAKIYLPQNQTVLTEPTTPPHFIGIGIGWQNYTCNSATNTFASVGAVADIADASCLAERDLELAEVSKFAYNGWLKAPHGVTPKSLIHKTHLEALGQHYFIVNPITGTGISPKWDFSAKGDAFPGNSEAFMVGSKVGDLPAPTGPKDIDWLQLKGVQGELGDTVYRVHTYGGQPPASCTPGTDGPLSVKYTAVYWFYGGSITRDPR